jgi:SHS2 domain-containing protein
MEKGYRVFDTTADTGLEMQGPSLEELFEQALKGLFDLITNLDCVSEVVEEEVHVEGEDWVDLLVSWLNELIFLHDARGWLFKSCVVDDLDPYFMKARCKGEIYQKGRHHINMLVKAATYHRAVVEKVPGGYRAQVVFDV